MLGNVGFFGMPVVAGIFPGEPVVSVYSSINVLTMNFLVFTIGAFMITNDKKYILHPHIFYEISNTKLQKTGLV